MFICTRCGNKLSRHTETKAGHQRYYCKPCGIKPFVPIELKRKNNNPPCPNQECEYYGKNGRVQKLYKFKNSQKQRYKCMNCNKSFMRAQDYVPKKVEDIEIVESNIPKDDYEKFMRKLTTRANRASLRELYKGGSIGLTVNSNGYDELEEQKKKGLSIAKIESDTSETDPFKCFEGMSIEEIFRLLPGEIVSQGIRQNIECSCSEGKLGYKNGVFDINTFLDQFDIDKDGE